VGPLPEAHAPVYQRIPSGPLTRGDKPTVPHGEDAGGIPYTLTWSLVGYPAVVVRAGTSVAGMPIGIQIAAAPWREDLALAAAAIVERALGGWIPPAV